MANWNYVSQFLRIDPDAAEICPAIMAVLTRGQNDSLLPEWNPGKNAFEFGSGRRKPFDFHWWMKLPLGHLRERLPAGTILDQLKTQLLFKNREFCCHCQQLIGDTLMLNSQVSVQCHPENFKELASHLTSKFQFVTCEGVAAFEMDSFWSSYARHKIEDGEFELSIQCIKDKTNNSNQCCAVEVLTSVQNPSLSSSVEAGPLAGIYPGSNLWTVYESMKDFPVTVVKP